MDYFISTVIFPIEGIGVYNLLFIFVNNIINTGRKIQEVKNKIKTAISYFNDQVGHFTDSQRVMKLREEVNELDGSIELGTPVDTVEECSDVIAISYHIATRNGYEGTPDGLFLLAYQKMKRRIESGERDYKNKDF